MSNFLPIGQYVLAKNHQFIAFNKPAGMPVQPDKTGDHSLHKLGEDYCHHPLFLMHRIDRAASGLVLMPKTNNTLQGILQQAQTGKLEKWYLAIVQQAPTKPEDNLTHYLVKRGNTNKTHVYNEPTEGAQESKLHYQIVGQSDNYTLLLIRLITGRHHQIRAQLAAIGSPIKGDVKYGARRANPDRSICLHSWRLTFTHPLSGEKIKLEAPLPDDNLWKAMGNLMTI